MYKNTVKKQRKIRTAINFEPKIRTVPLKVGQYVGNSWRVWCKYGNISYLAATVHTEVFTIFSPSLNFARSL